MSYFTPTTLPDALTLLRQHLPQVVAGCTDYFPAQAAVPGGGSLLDITRIDHLRCVDRTSKGWRIGAAVSWTELAGCELPSGFAALQAAGGEVGSVQIQNLGTIVGNVCNASPAADGVPPLLILGAEVEIASEHAKKVVPLEEFLIGPRRIALAPDEMVTALLIPHPPEAAHSTFLKLGSRTQMVISIAMVAAMAVVENGVIAEARVAVGSCSPVAQRLPALEAALKACPVTDIANLDLTQSDFYAGLSPISDMRGSAQYRCEVVPELCRRAVLGCLEKAQMQ